MLKSEIFELLIQPILRDVVAIAREHDIPFLTAFALDDDNDSSSKGQRAGCTITRADGALPPDFKAAESLLKNGLTPGLHPGGKSGVIVAESAADAMAQLSEILSKLSNTKINIVPDIERIDDNVVKADFTKKRD